MLSKTIRNAAAGGKRNNIFGIEINEFDLEAWANEAAGLEAECAGWQSIWDELAAENAELREIIETCRYCRQEAKDVKDRERGRILVAEGEEDDMTLSDRIRRSARHNYGTFAQKSEADAKRTWAKEVRKMEAVVGIARHFVDRSYSSPNDEKQRNILRDALADLEEYDE